MEIERDGNDGDVCYRKSPDYISPHGKMKHPTREGPIENVHINSPFERSYFLVPILRYSTSFSTIDIVFSGTSCITQRFLF